MNAKVKNGGITTKRSERKTPKEGHKFCAACGIEKPLAEFNIYKNSGKLRPCSYCKDCEHERDKNRYAHKCESCGKEYRSGKKDSKLCKECHTKKIAAIGAEYFKNRDFPPEANPWYGKPRYGTENPNYNPNKTDEERENGRIIPGYKEWVQSVYEKDGYTCQCCGDDRGGNLNAHHLDGYNWCKERRTDISNGITLCEKCHMQFHSIYGLRNNTAAQFVEFKEKYFTM